MFIPVKSLALGSLILSSCLDAPPDPTHPLIPTAFHSMAQAYTDGVMEKGATFIMKEKFQYLPEPIRDKVKV
jgi:hypothetical protein